MLSDAPPSARPVLNTAVELEIGDPRWEALVSRHPGALAFHRPQWAGVLAECYGYRPFVLAVLDVDGDLAGGLPVCEVRRLGRRSWIALPFTDMCPPLLRSDLNADVLTRSFDEARVSAQIDSFQVRSSLPNVGPVHARAAAVTHTLHLDEEPEALFQRFHRSQVQRNVRRAEREAITVRRADTRTDLTRTFYALHTQTRRRLGVPVQPRRFFEAIWERLVEPGHGTVLLAQAGRDAIAGAVFLTGGTTVTYKYGASDPAFWRLRPNHLLFWTAIRWASESGYRAFDFGRSDLDDQGLRDFKSGWNAAEEPLVYSTLAERAPIVRPSRSAGAARAVFRRSPAWFCRAAGAVLYRYAA